MGEEEGEKTTVDTTEVLVIAMGFWKGGTSGRYINKGGSTEGAMNTFTFLLSSVFVLIAEAKSYTELE